MADLFWDVATSNPVLLVLGLVLAAALVVGYFPLLKWLPFIGECVPAARLVLILTAALLGFLEGHRLADERMATAALHSKLEAAHIDLEAAEAAASEAQSDRAQLADQSKADQERIADYEQRLKQHPNDACILRDDDFAGRVRNSNRSR